jgi:hypothetical protein
MAFRELMSFGSLTSRLDLERFSLGDPMSKYLSLFLFLFTFYASGSTDLPKPAGGYNGVSARFHWTETYPGYGWKFFF